MTDCTTKARTLGVEPDMLLPEGKTCSDCRTFRRCVSLFGCRPGAVTCDWSPSAFVERAVSAKPPVSP